MDVRSLEKQNQSATTCEQSEVARMMTKWEKIDQDNMDMFENEQ